ncbi:hypothetical protein BJX64DRAFT_246177 [Aspergillus heterothallicus]
MTQSILDEDAGDDNIGRLTHLGDSQQDYTSANLKKTPESLPPEIRRRILFAADLSMHLPSFINSIYLIVGVFSASCSSQRSAASSLTLILFTNAAELTFSNLEVKSLLPKCSTHTKKCRLSEVLNLSRARTEDEIAGILSFHRSIIKPIARGYSTWALDNLSKESQRAQAGQRLPPPQFIRRNTGIPSTISPPTLLQPLRGEPPRTPLPPAASI